MNTYKCVNQNHDIRRWHPIHKNISDSSSPPPFSSIGGPLQFRTPSSDAQSGQFCPSVLADNPSYHDDRTVCEGQEHARFPPYTSLHPVWTSVGMYQLQHQNLTGHFFTVVNGRKTRNCVHRSWTSLFWSYFSSKAEGDAFDSIQAIVILRQPNWDRWSQFIVDISEDYL